MTAEAPLVIARRLLSRGLSVIPIPPPRPGVEPGHPGDGKVPAIAWREYQHRFPTDEELAFWFSDIESNVAVITGALSNVVVIDADQPDALRWCLCRLPYTPWQTKTAKGYHLWYRHPRRLVPNRARLETHEGKLAIDVRGDGGFVIAPGSVHASGVIYVEAGDWSSPLDALPRFWPGWIERPVRPVISPPPRSLTTETVLVERARRYLAAIPPPEIGAGSDTATLNAACRLVRGFALSSTDAESLLWAWCGNRPGWTRTWVAEKVLHALKYGKEPMGGLR
jgi:hypothetical protein